MAQRRRALKVYSWEHNMSREQGRALGDEPHHSQCYAFVAAQSQAEAARLAGYDRPSQMFNLGETGNKHDIRAAMGRPRIIFLQSMNQGRGGEYITVPCRRCGDKPTSVCHACGNDPAHPQPNGLPFVIEVPMRAYPSSTGPAAHLSPMGMAGPLCGVGRIVSRIPLDNSAVTPSVPPGPGRVALCRNCMKIVERARQACKRLEKE